MKIKRYTEFITENNSTYKYGCVMLHLKFKNWKEIISKIDENDVYNEEDGKFGLETQPHVTLLYGLHDEVSLDDVKKVFRDINEISVEIDGIGIFESEKYDVVKLNVKLNDTLKEINKRLTQLPHTTDYPDYKPHITLGYVKKGEGKKYEDPNYKYVINNSTRIKYSHANGKKDYFRLKDVSIIM